jgi:hypothetical protein
LMCTSWCLTDLRGFLLSVLWYLLLEPVAWQKKRIAGPAEFSVLILRLPYLKKRRRASREKGGPTWDDIYAGYKAFGQKKKRLLSLFGWLSQPLAQDSVHVWPANSARLCSCCEQVVPASAGGWLQPVKQIFLKPKFFWRSPNLKYLEYKY